jgi:hypothetical protein
MARLPTPGSDNGAWGTLLNDFLSQSHNDDGTLKADSIDTTQLSTTNAPANDTVLGYNGTSMTWVTPSSTPTSPQIFVQGTDPVASAQDGDIWIDTSS